MFGEPVIDAVADDYRTARCIQRSRSSLDPGVVVPMMNDLVFQRAEETFNRRNVIAG